MEAKLMSNNWSISQTKELFDTVLKSAKQGGGLSKAFAEISQKHGRSINSVRNFYYSQCKLFAMVPKVANELGIKTIETKRENFETFSQEEIKQLIIHILTNRVNGKSVRAILNEHSKQDPVLALRYMNKYRSMLSTHKNTMHNIMQELRQQNIPYYNPYTNSIITADQSDSRLKLASFLSKLEESELDKFIDIINKIVN
jgi:DNA-binding transcriptional regulator YhcF (GntR family)